MWRSPSPVLYVPYKSWRRGGRYHFQSIPCHPEAKSQILIRCLFAGLASSSNVSFTDDISGVLGLGFPRLSTISNAVVNGKPRLPALGNVMTDDSFLATPFFSTMAQNGQLDYPLFGLSLTRDDSGSLAFGSSN